VAIGAILSHADARRKRSDSARVEKNMRVTMALALLITPQLLAQTLTWIPGSSVKVEQMIGDCDYTAQAKTGVCTPTTSRTSTRARVLGTDLGASFEADGKAYFLFGDSIGPGQDYLASDTIATTTSSDPAAGLFLDFLTNSDGSPFFIKVPGVRLGASEVPNAGIRLDGGTYVVCTPERTAISPIRTPTRTPCSRVSTRARASSRCFARSPPCRMAASSSRRSTRQEATS